MHPRQFIPGNSYFVSFWIIKIPIRLCLWELLNYFWKLDKQNSKQILELDWPFWTKNIWPQWQHKHQWQQSCVTKIEHYFKIWIRIWSWTRLPLMLAFTCRSTWMKKAGHKEVSKCRTRGESEQFLAYRWGTMQVRDPPWLWNPVHEFNGKFLPPIPNILLQRFQFTET